MLGPRHQPSSSGSSPALIHRSAPSHRPSPSAEPKLTIPSPSPPAEALEPKETGDHLLLVYTAPARATIPADWCDHEHLPAHVAGAVPSVLSCSRWAAADNKTPACLSLYDLRLPVAPASAPPSPGGGSDATDSDGAAPIPKSAPPNFATYGGGGGDSDSDSDAEEEDFVQTRLYTPRAEFPSRTPPAEPASPSDARSLFSLSTTRTLAPSDGSGSDALDWRYISLIELELAPAAEPAFERWFDAEHAPLLARVPGWLRTRRFALAAVVASSPTPVPFPPSRSRSRRARRWRLNAGGGGCEYEYGRWEDGRGARPPRFLVVHEWASLDAFGSAEFKRATSTPWRAEVLAEDRVLRYDIRVFRAADVCVERD